MTTQRTTPNNPRRKHDRTERLIIVGVLLAVAACLGAVAAFGLPFEADGSKAASSDATAAVVSASPSPMASAGLTGDGAPESPRAKPSSSSSGSSAARAAGSGSTSAATTAAGSSGSSTANSGSSSGGSGGGSSGGGSSGGSSGGGSSGGGTSTTKPAKPAALTCTLSIDAETAGVGTIMATRKVTFKAGQTVFDVLQRECKAAGIPMEFEYTPMYESAYIEGINGLYEFDRGELSGWMYSVNGWFPNYGCSKYKLKTGDQIRWRYTCDLGRDIGGYVATGE